MPVAAHHVVMGRRRRPRGTYLSEVVIVMKPSIKQADPMSVAYINMHGPYQQIPLAMGMVYGWIGRKGLQPVGMPMGVYLTSPETVPEAEAVWEVWAPVGGDVEEAEPDDAGIGIKHIPAMTIASVVHKGPYESIAPTYDALAAWVAEQGYLMAGPPREAYLNDPGEVTPEEALTEVMFPVQRG